MVFTKEASESTIRRRLRREGWASSKIESYIRGWNLVKKHSNKKD